MGTSRNKKKRKNISRSNGKVVKPVESVKRSRKPVLIGALLIAGLSSFAFLHVNRVSEKKTPVVKVQSQTNTPPPLSLPKEEKSSFAKPTDVKVETAFIPKSKLNDPNNVAKLNLLCAKGLPGSEDLNIDECLKTLDKWAEWVKKETARHMYRYKKNPKEYYNSEAYFKVLLMVCILQEDFGVQYNPTERDRQLKGIKSSPAPARDSKDMFINGLLTGKHYGTCASMPVLYMIIGRKLGYPVRLVVAKNHVFLRWEDEKEKVNLEGSGHGLNIYSDEHYREYLKFNEEDKKSKYYFKSLNPAEEYALFLELRADVLRDNGMRSSALAIYNKLLDYRPDNTFIKENMAKVNSSIKTEEMKLTENAKEQARILARNSLQLINKAALRLQSDLQNKLMRISLRYSQMNQAGMKNNELMLRRQAEINAAMTANSMRLATLKRWQNEIKNNNGPAITPSQIEMLMGNKRDYVEDSHQLITVRNINRQIEQQRLDSLPQSPQPQRNQRPYSLPANMNPQYQKKMREAQQQIIHAQNMRAIAEENRRLLIQNQFNNMQK